jgi:cytochrome c6
VLVGLAAGACGPDPGTPAGLYYHQCARCHAVGGTGNPRSAKRMKGLDLTASEMVAVGDRAAVAQRIAEGEGAMPAFGDKLDPEEIATLVDYVLELAGPPAAPGR